MITRPLVRSRILIVVVALLTLVAAGCRPLSRPWGEVRIPGGQAIRIGLLTDADTLAGAAAAPETVPNIEVDGHPLEVVPVPVRCAAAAATATAPDPAVLAGLSGVVGSGCSSACVYAESLLFAQKTTLVASGCTATAVVQQGYPIAFRVAWVDADQAIVAADYARSTLHARTAAVVTDQSAYARALLPAYSSQFRNHGGSAVGQVDISPTGDVDVAGVVQRIKALNAETVLLAISRPDAGTVFAQLQAALTGRTIIATDTVFAPRSGVVAPSGLVAVGMVRDEGGWTSELDTGPLAPDLFSAQQADAISIFVHAIAAVARPQYDGTLVIPLQALRDAISRTRLNGATGRIEFDAAGERKHDVGAALYRLGSGPPALLQAYER